MEPENKKSLDMQRIKNLGFPVILAVFTLIVLALFFMVARFLSTNIDSAISSPDETQIQAQLTHINEEDYARVGVKLHLPAIQPIPPEVLPLPESATTTKTATSSPSAITPTPKVPNPVESHPAFSLALYNSTKQVGITNTVKNDLVAAGFAVTKTGTKTPLEPRTLVQIKERVQTNPAILEEILSILGKRFAIGDPQILESTSPYDIVIIIGTK